MFKGYLSTAKNNNVFTVYLSGGMNTEWRETVKEINYKNTYNIRFIDPTKNYTDDPDEYAFLDTKQVMNSDLVIAYLEKDNPSGIGLAYEVGLATALNIPVILVSEKLDDKRFDIIYRSASVRCTQLKYAINVLKRYYAIEYGGD